MDKKRLIEYFFISLGVFLVAIGFYYFLKPLKLITGGILGIGIIVDNLVPFSTSIFVLIMNVIAIIFGSLILGKQFFYRTIFGTLFLPLVLFFLELGSVNDLILKHVEPEMHLLIGAIFAGLLTGIGLGLVIRFNATTGGMDVYQRVLSDKAKIPFSIALIITDGVVILIGMVQDINLGLFALIALIITSITLEKVTVMGKNSYTGFIITDKYEQFKESIYKELDRGFTKIKVVGSYTENEKSMIMCTVYRHQIYTLKEIINEIDPNAFSIIMHTNEVIGSGFLSRDFNG